MSIKKEPSSPRGTANNESSTNNNNIKLGEKHKDLKKTPVEWEMPDLSNLKSTKSRNFAFIVYPESAPADWREKLCEFGIPFAVSPLHDKDKNPDGTPKKEHYHVLITYANTTTLKAVANLFMPVLHSPIPQTCASAKGMYRYFTHADNPEKYQYESSEITIYCGFEIPLDSKDVREITLAIQCYAIENGITEYGRMLMRSAQYFPEWFEVMKNHSVIFRSFFASLRFNPKEMMEEYEYITTEEHKND